MNATSKNWIPVVLAFSALAACGGSQEPEATDQAPVRAVATLEVEAATVNVRYEATGTLRGEQTAVMTSKTTGYVEQLLVEPGDTVRAGQPIAILATPELEVRLEAARAGLEEARQAEEEARAGLAAARAQAEVAEATYRRFAELHEKRAVTRQEIDEVEARRATAVAGVQAAVSRLARMSSGRTRAEAEVEAAKITLGYRTVRAPFDGRILERRTDLGNLAAPGSPLFVVEKEGPLRAEVAVEESLAGEISVGDAAWVLVGRGETAIPGVVTEVVPSVDPVSRAFLVKVDLPAEPRPEVFPGRFARVRFEVGETERLLVPRTSVFNRGQLDLLYVVEDGRLRLRLVTLGSPRGNEVEVLSGLTAGERIVLEPTADLVEGSLAEAQT